MKTLALLIALITVSAFAEIGPMGRSSILKYDGTVDANGREQRYINVLNKAQATLPIGTPVILDVTSDDGASVTMSNTLGAVPVCVIAVSCAASKMCLCQVYGYSSIPLFDAAAGSATAGKRGYLSTGTVGYLAARPAEVYGEVPMGIFYDSSTVSGAVEFFLDL